MNQITERQKQDHFVRMLAAQRQLYDDEKRWLGIWLVVAPVIAAMGTGAIRALTPYIAYLVWLSVIVMLGEFVALDLIMKRRKEAAKVQELYDCELLEIPWNDAQARKPKPETIAAAAQRHLDRATPEEQERLRKWYTSVVDELPLHQARIVCQRQNIWWDSQQRREYSFWVCGVVILLIISVISIGVVANWNLQQFFAGPVSLSLPLILLGLKNAGDHRKAADRLDELRDFADDLWTQANAPTAQIDVIERGSRELQTQIFRHRSENPPVFSWVYRRLRDKYEEASSTPGHLFEE